MWRYDCFIPKLSIILVIIGYYDYASFCIKYKWVNFEDNYNEFKQFPSKYYLKIDAEDKKMERNEK